MVQQQKQACVLFRTIVEAAKEMNKEEALELLLTYADYALGDTEEIETDNKYIKLILKQLVPALSAAEKRYEAACKNGPKGKEYGKKGGRPRKGETKEQAYERRNPSKTPEQSPVATPVNNYQETPVKPLDVEEEVEVDAEADKEKEIYTEISKDNIKENKYKNLPWEEYLKMFINRHPGYNYDLESSIFVCTYADTLQKYQQFILDNTNMNIPLDALSFELRYYYATGKTF